MGLVGFFYIEAFFLPFWSWVVLLVCVFSSEGRDAIQRDLDRLEKCAQVNCMRFNEAKCKVLHWVRAIPGVYTKCEKNSLSAEEKLNVSQQCAFAAKCILGCIKQGLASRVRDIIVLLSSALMRPHLQYCIQARGPQHKKHVELLK